MNKMIELNAAKINEVSGAMTPGEAAGVTAVLMTMGDPVGICVGAVAICIYALM
jgi:hypothetical protein